MVCVKGTGTRCRTTQAAVARCTTRHLDAVRHRHRQLHGVRLRGLRHDARRHRLLLHGVRLEYGVYVNRRRLARRGGRHREACDEPALDAAITRDQMPYDTEGCCTVHGCTVCLTNRHLDAVRHGLHGLHGVLLRGVPSSSSSVRHGHGLLLERHRLERRGRRGGRHREACRV